MNQNSEPKQTDAAITQLAIMRAKGLISDDEFEAAKAAIAGQRSREPDPVAPPPPKPSPVLSPEDLASKPGFIDITGRYASRPKLAEKSLPVISPAWFFLPLAVGIVVLFIANLPATDRCKDRIGAFVMSQDFAKDRLKSPATAVFPIINEDGIKVVSNGNCGFLIHSYVDSQNGFGASVRTWYAAELTPDKNGTTWHLNDFAFKGE